MCFLVLVVSFCSNIHVYGFMYLLDVLISISLCTAFSNFCFQSYLFHLHTFVFASVHSPLFFSNFFMVLFGLSLFHFYMSVLFLVFSFYVLIYCQFNIAIYLDWKSLWYNFCCCCWVFIGNSLSCKSRKYISLQMNILSPWRQYLGENIQHFGRV